MKNHENLQIGRRFLPFICVLLLLAFAADAIAEKKDVASSFLPVVRLESALLSTLESKPGKITVEAAPGEAFTSDITLKYRGTYSASFTLKRNYTLHLKQADGSQRKESLLGLGRDDDYALLGGYSDPSRLRILVGLDLFRAACGAAARGTLCEVYFGDYYKGIYTLAERPERKTAAVPKNGALYRVLAAKVEDVDVLSDAPPTLPAGESWYNIGKVYPAGDDGWQALQRLNRFLTEVDDAAFASEMHAYFDLTAFADYYLFVNLIGATDNMQKNLFLAWDGEGFYPMPWDLDAAFGRLYNAERSDPEAWYSSPLFDRLLKTEAFCRLLPARYAALRQQFLPDAVCARFIAYADYLQACGALDREAERFGVYTDITTQKSHRLDVYGEISFIRTFMQQRIALLDAVFLQ